MLFSSSTSGFILQSFTLTNLILFFLRWLLVYPFYYAKMKFIDNLPVYDVTNLNIFS